MRGSVVSFEKRLERIDREIDMCFESLCLVIKNKSLGELEKTVARIKFLRSVRSFILETSAKVPRGVQIKMEVDNDGVVRLGD